MKQTPLYDLHVTHEAKFGPFAGYEMPLFYKAGIMTEHQHTRQSAGLFDISHMMPVIISGPQAAAAVSYLCPLPAADMESGHARYTFFLNEYAGIIDDLIVSKLDDDRFMVVCNAGCADKDWAHIEKETASFDITAQKLDAGLIALQGPKAQEVIEEAGIDVSDMLFMQIRELDGKHEGWKISRAGYTGEDGFEVLAPSDQIAGIAEQLVSDERVLPIGLGARDSLRLEAGLSLYGQDLSDEITPMEAGLTWAIAKDLRSGGTYIGAGAVEEKIAAKRRRKRVGLKPEGRAPVRAGARILDQQGREIGWVTSGGFGPSVEHPVAMGMIEVNADTNGMAAEVRNRTIPLELASLPFSPHNYKR